MGAIGEEEAIKSMKSWAGAPKDCRLVCSSSSTDAGIIASFFNEALGGSQGNVLLITPNCDSSSDANAMGRLAEYLNSICPWADVQALKGAPQPCFSFNTKNRPDFAPSANSAQGLSKDQVMSKVLDWFTQMLINLDDEEEYIAIGRSLLSVLRYEVTTASSEPAMAEAFWKEVKVMSEQQQEGNIIIVMPDFMQDDFEKFDSYVRSKLALPLSWGGNPSSKKLEVSAYHPEGPRELLRSPWPLVQISVFDPAPPKQNGDLTFEDEMEELSFNAEMETLRVPSDKLREANEKSKAKKIASESDAMPGFPLKLDELT